VRKPVLFLIALSVGLLARGQNAPSTSQSQETPPAQQHEFRHTLNELFKVHLFFEQMRIASEFCSEKLPDLRDSTLKSYEAWEAKNASVRREIAQMFNDEAANMYGGVENAMIESDKLQASMRAHVDALPPDAARKNCEGYPGFLASNDPNVVFAKELADVRDYFKTSGDVFAKEAPLPAVTAVEISADDKTHSYRSIDAAIAGLDALPNPRSEAAMNFILMIYRNKLRNMTVPFETKDRLAQYLRTEKENESSSHATR
jgi:hypothetical protein